MDSEEERYITENEFKNVVQTLLKRFKTLEKRVEELEKINNSNNSSDKQASLSNMRFQFANKDE